MKNLNLIVVIFLFSTISYSQDNIITHRGDVIICMVSENGENVINDKNEAQDFSKNTSNNQTQIDLQNMSIFRSHLVAAPKKYYYEGENTNESLQLRYKNPNNNITYYLTSNQLETNINVRYYLDAYKANQVNGGFSVSEIQFHGMRALLGKMQMQTAYIYQLHFVNAGKGQTIQMLAGRPSDKEFETYMNEIKILK